MKNLFIIIIIFISHLSSINSQDNIAIELSEGFVFFDYFGKEPKGFDKVFAGYGLQTEFNLWRTIYKYKSIQSKIGLGYTNYYYLYDYGFSFIAREEVSTSYLNLKLGMDYKPTWSKITLLLNLTNYFLLHKEKQQYSQNRWFSNLDIGLRIKLLKKIHLSLWSPITISPLHEGLSLSRPKDMSIHYKPWIEITGLNLGISYSFGGK